MSDEIFKCHFCGEKYEHTMASDDDISICKWCNSFVNKEEKNG
jgi:hypothetical protein|tara:strand:- start:52 stop:180 length:129 start_codon:yes stop_codon:yes gene_type:complete